MKLKYFLMFLGLFFYMNALSTVKDSIRVTGKNLNANEIKLYSYSDQLLIASTKLINREFVLLLPDKIEPGVYRMEFDEVYKTDIIIDTIEKEISLELSKNKGSGTFSLIFTKSPENIKWNKYVNKFNPEILKLEKMFSFLSTYPKDQVNKFIVMKYSYKRKKYYKGFLNFIKHNKNTWAACMVKNRPFYFSDLNKPPVLRDYIRRNFYWEGIDTNNPKLINSPLYINQIATYFEYINSVSHHSFNPIEKEYELKKSIDTVLRIFSSNEKTKQFSKKYLLQIFTLDQNFQMVDYISNSQ